MKPTVLFISVAIVAVPAVAAWLARPAGMSGQSGIVSTMSSQDRSIGVKASGFGDLESAIVSAERDRSGRAFEVVLPEVGFEPGSLTFKPGTEAAIRRWSAMLVQHPDVKIELVSAGQGQQSFLRSQAVVLALARARYEPRNLRAVKGDAVGEHVVVRFRQNS